MEKEPIFTFDKETGITTCSLECKGKTFTGTAKCHPDDFDFMARATGENIAAIRATINYFKYIRDCEMKPALRALKHLKGCMVNSKHYNENSYEARFLDKEIKNYENDLKEIKLMIAEEKINLKLYIVQKDVYYKLLRERRQKAENN